MDEPTPSRAVIQKAFIATPHIAGYSIEGKLNGTTMVVKECARVFKCLKEHSQVNKPLLNWPYGLENIVRDIHGHGFPITLFNSELELRSISNAFKALQLDQLTTRFKDLRANHPSRHDFNTYSLEGMIDLDESLSPGLLHALKEL